MIGAGAAVEEVGENRPVQRNLVIAFAPKRDAWPCMRDQLIIAISAIDSDRQIEFGSFRAKVVIPPAALDHNCIDSAAGEVLCAGRRIGADRHFSRADGYRDRFVCVRSDRVQHAILHEHGRGGSAQAAIFEEL